MRKNDILLIGFMCILTLVLCFGMKIISKKGKSAVIIVDGREIAHLSLDEDIVFWVKDKNKIEVKDGEVFMSYAECPDNLCIKQGRISETGKSIVCLPNRLTVRIEN